VLSYYENEGAALHVTNVYGSLRGSVNMKHCSVQAVSRSGRQETDQGFHFTLVSSSNGRVLECACREPHERDVWVQKIQDAINKSRGVLRTYSVSACNFGAAGAAGVAGGTLEDERVTASACEEGGGAGAGEASSSPSGARLDEDVTTSMHEARDDVARKAQQASSRRHLMQHEQRHHDKPNQAACNSIAACNSNSMTFHSSLNDIVFASNLHRTGKPSHPSHVQQARRFRVFHSFSGVQ
jgi:hypothetical protein